MKKFTLLVAVLAISLVTFAQTKITYELNGGVTNDYGWQSKAEIALDLQNDYNTTYETSKAWALDSMGVIYYKRGSKWVTPDVVQGQPSTLAGFIQASTYTTTQNFLNLISCEKYSWLMDVVKANRLAQGLDTILDSPANNDAMFRKEISGFFLASPSDASWPATSSFQVTADYAAFAPIWKHAFCGPDSIFAGETIALPTPYKEDESFVGWYRTPDFSDERITELTYTKGETEIVLYAKYGEYIPCVKEVIAMANDSVTKVQGTVSYVAGSNFWIQDATAGILCYGKNHGLAEGDLVVLAGKRADYKGSPELALDSVVEKRAGKAVAYQTTPLAAIVADTLAYLNEFVYIEGVTFSRYEDKGDYKTPYVTDGMTEIALYN
jgi:hypothetical protein